MDGRGVEEKYFEVSPGEYLLLLTFFNILDINLNLPMPSNCNSCFTDQVYMFLFFS